MGSILNSANGRDLLIAFVISTVAGFAYVYLDNFVLSKIETAVGIPAGVW